VTTFILWGFWFDYVSYLYFICIAVIFDHVEGNWLDEWGRLFQLCEGISFDIEALLYLVKGFFTFEIKKTQKSPSKGFNLLPGWQYYGFFISLPVQQVFFGAFRFRLLPFPLYGLTALICISFAPTPHVPYCRKKSRPSYAGRLAV